MRLSGDLDAARWARRLGARCHVDRVAEDAETAADLAHNARYSRATMDAFGVGKGREELDSDWRHCLRSYFSWRYIIQVSASYKATTTPQPDRCSLAPPQYSSLTDAKFQCGAIVHTRLWHLGSLLLCPQRKAHHCGRVVRVRIHQVRDRHVRITNGLHLHGAKGHWELSVKEGPTTQAIHTHVHTCPTNPGPVAPCTHPASLQG